MYTQQNKTILSKTQKKRKTKRKTTQPAKSLKSNIGGSFCWIGIQYAMPYTQKYTPPHWFFCNFAGFAGKQKKLPYLFIGVSLKKSCTAFANDDGYDQPVSFWMSPACCRMMETRRPTPLKNPKTWKIQKSKYTWVISINKQRDTKCAKSLLWRESFMIFSILVSFREILRYK